jgi:hypothetical protein
MSVPVGVAGAAVCAWTGWETANAAIANAVIRRYFMAKSSGIGTRIYQESLMAGTPDRFKRSGGAAALRAEVGDDIGTGEDGPSERGPAADLSRKRSGDRLSGIFP